MRKSYGMRCCQRGFTFNDQIQEFHPHNTQFCQFYQVNPLSYFSFTLCNLLLTNRKVLRIIITFYKITKIVRALWLAERSVCMRVCKHGCGVKLFGFSRANHASTKFEKVFEFNTRQVYFIYPFLRRLKLGKSLQRRCVNFFSRKLTFESEKSVFWKSSFCKTRTCPRH